MLIANTPPHIPSKTIKGWDLLKFIMAFLIVNIHCETTDYWDSQIVAKLNSCINSISVPAFFVLSSIFVFRKTRTSNSFRSLLSFEIRLNKLYMSWIIVWIPIILLAWHKEYLDFQFPGTLLLFVKNYFFAYQFGASWFLGALIVGVPLIYICARTIGDYLLWIIPLSIYLYINMADETYLIYSWYAENIRIPSLSFPSGLLWICIGYYLSKDAVLKAITSIPQSINVIILMIYVCLGIFFIEYRYIYIIPAVIALLSLFYNIKLSISDKKSITLRNCSILIFCFHYSMIICLKKIPIFDNKVILFCVASIICVVTAIMILRISEKDKYSWMKNLY